MTPRLLSFLAFVLFSALAFAEEPEPLTARIKAAEALIKDKKDAEAEPLLRALLPAIEKVFTINDYRITQVWRDIALCLHHQGKREQAFTEYRAFIKSQYPSARPADEDALRLRMNLVRMMSATDAFDLAEKELKSMIPIYESMEGVGSPNYLQAQSELAQALRRQTKTAELENLINDMGAIADHMAFAPPMTTSAVREMAASIMESGAKWELAEAQYRKMLAAKENIERPERYNGDITRLRLASNLHTQKKYAEAVKEYRIVLESREKSLGKDHRDTLEVRNRLENEVKAMEKAKAELKVKS